jgi:hypothetical protein
VSSVEPMQCRWYEDHGRHLTCKMEPRKDAIQITHHAMRVARADPKGDQPNQIESLLLFTIYSCLASLGFRVTSSSASRGSSLRHAVAHGLRVRAITRQDASHDDIPTRRRGESLSRRRGPPHGRSHRASTRHCGDPISVVALRRMCLCVGY